MTKTVTVQAQQKWEFTYAMRRSEAALLNEINVLGHDGWDLVTVMYHKDPKGAMAWFAFLKRPSTGQAPKQVEQLKSNIVLNPSEEAAPTQDGFDLSDGEFQIKSE